MKYCEECCMEHEGECPTEIARRREEIEREMGGDVGIAENALEDAGIPTVPEDMTESEYRRRYVEGTSGVQTHEVQHDPLPALPEVPPLEPY